LQKARGISAGIPSVSNDSRSFPARTALSARSLICRHLLWSDASRLREVPMSKSQVSSRCRTRTGRSSPS
jgi:hypothetical protein